MADSFFDLVHRWIRRREMIRYAMAPACAWEGATVSFV
jgi:hypothetical protein